MLKGYATRTRISIGGIQKNRDTLIEQSPTCNYSNKTFSVSIKVGSVMEFPNLPAPIHTMKCIGLFKRLVHLLV